MTEEKIEYKTNYSNPNCKNKEDKDCSIGKVNTNGLCKNCYYRSLDENDKVFLLRHLDANRYAEQDREDRNALVKFAIVVIAIIAILTIVLKLIT